MFDTRTLDCSVSDPAYSLEPSLPLSRGVEFFPSAAATPSLSTAPDSGPATAALGLREPGKSSSTRRPVSALACNRIPIPEPLLLLPPASLPPPSFDPRRAPSEPDRSKLALVLEDSEPSLRPEAPNMSKRDAPLFKDREEAGSAKADRENSPSSSLPRVIFVADGKRRQAGGERGGLHMLVLVSDERDVSRYPQLPSS